MGFFKSTIFLLAGLYAGIYLDQNYKLPKVDDPKDFIQKMNDWLEQNKKDVPGPSKD